MLINKNMIIENSFEQGSKEWEIARVNSIGGTDLSSILRNSDGERSDSRPNFLIEKAGDILSQDPKPNFQSWEMRWGHKYEPKARQLFEMLHGVDVKTCAMIFNDELRQWHISPDFYFTNQGGEIKCYQLKAFKKCVKDNKLPTKHNLQIQGGLALTGWDCWWFMAYFPTLKPFIIKVERDEPMIKKIKAEVRIFIDELNHEVEELRAA